MFIGFLWKVGNVMNRVSAFKRHIYLYYSITNLLSVSPIQLPLIMPLNSLYRLWQCSCSSMQMIRMWCFMLMKYHAVPFFRIIRIMQIPIMFGISGLHRHIIFTQQDNIKILWIDCLKLSCIKHSLPPLWQTMCSMPVPKLP